MQHYLYMTSKIILNMSIRRQMVFRQEIFPHPYISATVNICSYDLNLYYILQWFICVKRWLLHVLGFVRVTVTVCTYPSATHTRRILNSKDKSQGRPMPCTQLVSIFLYKRNMLKRLQVTIMAIASLLVFNIGILQWIMEVCWSALV
jgi:hypothetical protein